jgi:putative permease
MTTNKPAATPFYTKLAMTLVSIIAIVFIATQGKKIISPIIFSILFSIVLLPVASFFESRLHFKRSLASIFSVLVLVTFLGGILYIVGSQLSNLISDWPLFKQQLLGSVDNIQDWVSATFHVNISKQKTYINNATSSALSEGTAVVGATVLSLSSILLFLVFTLIYTFFILFYRRLILRFLISVFKKEDSVIVYDVAENVQFIIRKYIVGLLFEMAIVATVCCTAFMIIGIKYAILLGLITGLFNIIPYIGIFTSLVLSTLITFATAAGTTKMWLVAAVIVGMHLVDSNVLLPLIVGSKVKINALITVLGVVIGEMLWGISGMFLSIPVIAVLKIICDRVESLKPWGLLLGDEKDEPSSPKKPSLEEQTTDQKSV